MKQSRHGQAEVFVELIDGLSDPLSISRDKQNNFVSGFGAQDSTDVLIIPYNRQSHIDAVIIRL
jgi:hypothetical protein